MSNARRCARCRQDEREVAHGCPLTWGHSYVPEERREGERRVTVTAASKMIRQRRIARTDRRAISSIPPSLKEPPKALFEDNGHARACPSMGVHLRADTSRKEAGRERRMAERSD